MRRGERATMCRNASYAGTERRRQHTNPRETSMSTYTAIDAAIDGFLNTTPWAMDLLLFFVAGVQ